MARSKMISFRLSSVEYEQFRQYCGTHGGSSVSELARAAVNRLIREAAGESTNGLEGRINELETQLHLLALELKNVKGRVPDGSSL